MVDDVTRQATAMLFATWLGHVGRQAVMEAALRVLHALTTDVEPTVVTDRRILRAVAYINANLRGPITLEAVAQDACLSPGRFRHLFVEQTGMGLPALRAVEAVHFRVGPADAGQIGVGGCAWSRFCGFRTFRTSRHTFGFPPSLMQVGRTPDPES